MKKDKIITLYIPDWIPILEDEKLIRDKFNSINNFEFFDWSIKFKDNEKENSTYIKVEALIQYLLDYFIRNKNHKFNIIINTFSQLIFFNIYEKIKNQIDKIILINPIDNFFYLKVAEIKRKLLPTNNVNNLKKYIYLFYQLSECKEFGICKLKMREEIKLFNGYNLHYHKLFDQVLKFNYIKRYLNWINYYSDSMHVIIGNKNPLIDLQSNQKIFDNNKKNYHIINDCGYCIIWEKHLELLEIIKRIIK